MTQPTSRVRLYGGTLIHNATPNGPGHITTCRHYIFAAAVADADWLPDDTTLTCRICHNRSGDTT
jgi:hypothetical protein